MTNRIRIDARSTRSRARLLTQGLSSIAIDQQMTIARKAIASGSVAGDWQAVGDDLRRTLGGIAREFEAA